MLFGHLGELRGILLFLLFGGMQSEWRRACQSHVDHKYKLEESGRLRLLEMAGASFSEPDQEVLCDPGEDGRDGIEWRKHEDMVLVREDVSDGDTCSQNNLGFRNLPEG